MSDTDAVLGGTGASMVARARARVAELAAIAVDRQCKIRAGVLLTHVDVGRATA